MVTHFRADFKLIAKALARMGNAYKRMDELDKAKAAYEKALTEHRTPEYRTSLSEVRVKATLTVECCLKLTWMDVAG